LKGWVIKEEATKYIMEREEGSEPIVVINGKAEREALGTTLGDLFRYYPNSYLIERPHDESSKKKGSKTATENGHPKDGVSSAPPLVIRQADYELKSHCVYELKTGMLKQLDSQVKR